MRSPRMRYAGQRSRMGSCRRGTARLAWLEMRLEGGGGRNQDMGSWDCIHRTIARFSVGEQYAQICALDKSICRVVENSLREKRLKRHGGDSLSCFPLPAANPSPALQPPAPHWQPAPPRISRYCTNLVRHSLPPSRGAGRGWRHRLSAS